MSGFPKAVPPAHVVLAAQAGDRHRLSELLFAGATVSTWSFEAIGHCLSSLQARAAYFLADREGLLLGGAGIRPLPGAVADVCELGGIYVDERFRRRGLGASLVEHCMAVALAFGYRQCYAELTAVTPAAARLLGGHGFSALGLPMGRTGRTDAAGWYLRDL